MRIETKYIVDDEDIALLRAIPENPCTTCTVGAECCGCPDVRPYSKAIEEAKKRIPDVYVEKYSRYLDALKARDKAVSELRKAEAPVEAFEKELSSAGLGAALGHHHT